MKKQPEKLTPYQFKKNLEFQKNVPEFIKNMYQEHSIKEVTIEDKSKQSGSSLKDIEYDDEQPVIVGLEDFDDDIKKEISQIYTKRKTKTVTESEKTDDETINREKEPVDKDEGEAETNAKAKDNQIENVNSFSTFKRKAEKKKSPVNKKSKNLLSFEEDD